MVTRATSSSSSSCPPEEAQRKKFWPLIELKAEKGFFIEVIAMWLAFFAYSLVEATGSTFFFEQMRSLDTESGIGLVMDVAVFLILVSRFSSFLVSFIYDLLIPKQWRKATVTLARYYYASHISELILGVGKLVTDSSILVFRRSWFHDNINWSRLDRLLELLTYLSLANLIYCMCISVYFYRNEKSRKSANKGNKESSLLEQVEPGIHAAEKETYDEEVQVPVGGADVENKQTAQEQVDQEIDDDDKEVWTSEITKEIKKWSYRNDHCCCW